MNLIQKCWRNWHFYPGIYLPDHFKERNAIGKDVLFRFSCQRYPEGRTEYCERFDFLPEKAPVEFALKHLEKGREESIWLRYTVKNAQ
ncbi:MAG: hypothetical protein Q4B13_02970 [Lautropia sp.]|nr:hypothetical protein [Lautropia sp.]